MFSSTILQYSSISQWALFLGIALTLFGWFEKKDKILLSGQLLFLLLGLFALWILFTEKIDVPQIIGANITREVKIISFYKGVVILAGIDLISLLMKLFKLRFQTVSNAILILVALMLFFMIFNILRMPA